MGGQLRPHRTANTVGLALHLRSFGEHGDAESERVAVSRGPFLGPVSRPGTRDLSVALYSRIGSNL